MINEDGFLRLSFKDARTEVRPEYYEEDPGRYGDPDFTLVRLAWHLDEILPDMPNLFRSCELGCAFCNALRVKLKNDLAKEARYYTVHDGPLILTVYLSLGEKGVEGLLVEGAFNQEKGIYGVIQIFFPIEAAPRRSSI
jgi:hypothetical protein